MTSKCCLCKQEKDFSAFYKDKNRKLGITPRCKVCTKKYQKKRYQENKESFKISSKKWEKANPDKVLERSRRFYKNNKQKLRKSNLERYHKNKEKINKYHTAYTNKKYNEDINYKLQHNLRTRLNSALKNNSKKGKTISYLGCSIEELKKHLESQFIEGMSWENWSRDGWHIDHIMPLSSFDLSKEEEIKKACHYTNLQPLWARQNLQKNNKIPL